MELVRLNTDNWRSNEMIQGYSSLIWTERYLGAGEFSLTTRDVAATKALLPRNTKVSLRDTQEVMNVETHTVDKDEEGAPQLIITGRTFETLLESRSTVVIQDNDGGFNNMWVYEHDDIWPTVAAKGLIMSHLTQCNEEAKQRFENTTVEVLIDEGDHPGEKMSYEHTAGPLYPEIIKLLDMENAGIRNQLELEEALRIYIYHGLNRSVNQDDRPAIVFNLDAEHIVDPSYLWSIKDYRNVAYVVGEYWQQVVYAPGVNHGVTGENRRILHVDGSKIKEAWSDAKKKRTAKAIGLAALAKQNEVFFFDAEATPYSPYVRGVNYNLGDKVTLVAQYGVSQSMVVSEFIRTEDKTGERSWPTLVTPNELEAGT